MDANTQSTIAVVRRGRRAGHKAAHEAWLDRLTTAAIAGFPGYMGAEFHRPASTGDPYRTIFRFDSLAQPEGFEAFGLPYRVLAPAAPLFAAVAVRVRMTGLEFRFDRPPGTRVPYPSPHCMELVLICVIFVLVMATPHLRGPHIHGRPLAPRGLTVVTLQVLLMTYLTFPRLNPAFAPFAYPTPKPSWWDMPWQTP